MNKQLISVVYTTHNRLEVLGCALDHLLLNLNSDYIYEIIISFDNEQIDLAHSRIIRDLHMENIVRFVCLQHTGNKGIAQNKNNAISQVSQTASHLFIFDDDTFPIKTGWEQEFIDTECPHLNYTPQAEGHVKVISQTENSNVIATDMLWGCMLYFNLTMVKLEEIKYNEAFQVYGYEHCELTARIAKTYKFSHTNLTIKNLSEFIYSFDYDWNFLKKEPYFRMVNKPFTSSVANMDLNDILRTNEELYHRLIK